MTVSIDHPGDVADVGLHDAVAGTLVHAGDLARLMADGTGRWTDALLSEVRSHLAGCLNSVQIAIALQLGDNWLAHPVEALGPGYCRTAIERHPALVSPPLLRHLRARAVAALALRMAFSEPSTGEPADDGGLAMAMDGALLDAVIALRFSMDPWLGVHPAAQPMRADLPADIFCDLIWTATALMIDGLAVERGVEEAIARPILIRAAEAVIARHDEQVGPFARAAHIAITMPPGKGAEELATDAAVRREMLLVAALAGVAAGISPDHALDLLIDGTGPEGAALSRLAGLGDDAYAALLDTLAPVRADLDEFVLPEMLATYRTMTVEAARRLLARWRGPAALTERILQIERYRA